LLGRPARGDSRGSSAELRERLPDVVLPDRLARAVRELLEDRRVARVAAPLLVAVVGESDNAAYDVLTKQNLPLPNVVVRAPRLITKANIGSVSSSSNELARIKRGTLSR